MQSNKPNNGKMHGGHKEKDQMAGNNMEGTSQQFAGFQLEENDETSHTEGQIYWPIHQEIKIQLAKETWFDLLTFVPRHQLGQIVLEIGDRRFAALLQSFLHNYRDITLGDICINRPPGVGGRKDLRACMLFTIRYYGRHENLVLPDVEMPKNIKDFLMIRLSYVDTSVLNFLQKFQQNSLFGNVNLNLNIQSDWDSEDSLTLLSYVLPLINNINSIRMSYIIDIIGNDDMKVNKTLAIDMLKMTRILAMEFCDYKFKPEEIAVLNRWLCTARDDGKPRMLIFPEHYCKSLSNALNFINGNIKSEFSKAKSAISFFIRIFVRDDAEWQDICSENVETKEKLVIKTVDSHKVKLELEKYSIKQKMVLISRYSSNVGKKWIEKNEKEAVEWEFHAQNSRIIFDHPVINAIPWNYEHSDTAGREARYQSNRKNDGSNYKAKDHQ